MESAVIDTGNVLFGSDSMNVNKITMTKSIQRHEFTAQPRRSGLVLCLRIVHWSLPFRFLQEQDN